MINLLTVISIAMLYIYSLREGNRQLLGLSSLSIKNWGRSTGWELICRYFEEDFCWSNQHISVAAGQRLKRFPASMLLAGESTKKVGISMIHLMRRWEAGGTLGENATPRPFPSLALGALTSAMECCQPGLSWNANFNMVALNLKTAQVSKSDMNKVAQVNDEGASRCPSFLAVMRCTAFYVCWWNNVKHLNRTGWWFGTFFIFPYMGILIPTDELIFFRGE